MPTATDRKSPVTHAIFGRQSPELLAELVAGLDRNECRNRLSFEMLGLAPQHGARFGIGLDDGSVNIRQQACNGRIQEQLPVVARPLVDAGALSLEGRVLNTELFLGDLELFERRHEQSRNGLDIG